VRTRRVALVACGGLLAALALGPFGFWPAEPVGLGVLAVALSGRRASARAGLGFAFGVGFLAIGLAFAWHFSGIGAVAFVIFEAGFFAAAAVLAGPAGRPGAFAGALVCTEWLRGVWPFGGVPISTLALGEATGPLACLARLGGPLLVTAASAALGASVVGIVARAARTTSRRIGGVPHHLGITVCGALVLLAVLAATIAPRGGPARSAVRAAAVQGGGERGFTGPHANAPTSLAPGGGPFDSAHANALEGTLEAARALGAGTALVVFPEDVVDLTGPFVGTSVARSLEAWAKARHTTLLVGVTEDASRQRFYNRIIVIGPEGSVLTSFEKERGVPFGEFVPFRGLLSHLVNFNAVPRDMIPGHASGMVKTPVGRLGILISYETYFPQRARASVRAGAEALVTETNTSSYATSQVPATELAASRLQAIADGRDLLQAATTGYSAVITPAGAVSGRTELGRPALVTTSLPLRTGMTVYDDLGDLPVLLVALVLIALGLRRRTRWRALRRGSATV
jgi:apolipoprotein N-acyltransferase